MLVEKSDENKRLKEDLNQRQFEIEKLIKRLEEKEYELAKIKNSLTYRILEFITLVRTKVLFFLNNEKDRMEKSITLLRKSKLFDVEYYLQNNQDVKDADMDAAKHFLLYGGFEGRNPSVHFDSHYYLSHYPDVRLSGMNPLIHFMLFGEKEGREISGVNCQDEIINVSDDEPIIEALGDETSTIDAAKDISIIRESACFDEAYYLKTYPDIGKSGIDSLIHYYYYGWKEGRNPSNHFETHFYLMNNPDVKATGINPLLHYILIGEKEQRSTGYQYEKILSKPNTFEEPNPINQHALNSGIRLIAFYLPQFHPIPENDKWWGKGFTEWFNVVRAKPQFNGHYQPHLPIDLGFYDLRIPEVMEQQVEMANSFGINGFCFYYYWFNGKRLLEKPLDMFLEHQEWNLNFCVCWANENWTRRWDGQEKDILMAQNHFPGDDIDFIKDYSKYSRDKRYIRIDNKPLVIIYRPDTFPNIQETAKRWRDFYKKTYDEEILIAMIQSFGNSNPEKFGLDLAIEFPPHTMKPTDIKDEFETFDFYGKIYDVKNVSKDFAGKLSKVDYSLFRGVMTSWDNTARVGSLSNIHFIDPQNYRDWLMEACNDTMKNVSNPSKRLVFINAWNEWGEGAHLEPDQKHGYAYLNATKQVLEELQ